MIMSFSVFFILTFKNQVLVYGQYYLLLIIIIINNNIKIKIVCGAKYSHI